MLYLRPYKPCDAETVLSWCQDEKALRQWTADRLSAYAYPVTAEQFNGYFRQFDGEANYFPMTAFDEAGAAAGFFLLRWPEADHKTVRLGFLILDGALRGRGLGRRLVELSCRYAFEFLGAERVTLAVFDNNPAARRCYERAGFAECERSVYTMNGAPWPCAIMERYRSKGEAAT